MEKDRRRVMGKPAEPQPREFSSFGGLYVTPGPLVYENGAFRVQDYWNEVCSYNSKQGLTEGSTYFKYNQVSGISGLSFDVYDDWVLPSQNNWKNIIGTESGYKRNGSTVNGGYQKRHYALIVTTITYGGSSKIAGTLFFPDDKAITGKKLSGFDGTTQTTGVSASDLNNYLQQGCVFLPCCGYAYGLWDKINDYGRYHTNTSGKCMQVRASSYPNGATAYTDSVDSLMAYLVRTI